MPTCPSAGYANLSNAFAGLHPTGGFERCLTAMLWSRLALDRGAALGGGSSEHRGTIFSDPDGRSLFNSNIPKRMAIESREAMAVHLGWNHVQPLT